MLHRSLSNVPPSFAIPVDEDPSFLENCLPIVSAWQLVRTYQCDRPTLHVVADQSSVQPRDQLQKIHSSKQNLSSQLTIERSEKLIVRAE
jgi:hypothetical protein